MRTAFRLRTGRGALWVIALLFLASAGLRAALGAATLAETGTAPKPQPAEPVASCDTPPDLAAALAMIAERQAALDLRDAELAERAATLRHAREEVGRQLAALEGAEARLSRLVSVADVAAEDDLNRLTAVYENMKPKEAAALFETMAPEFAAGFLARMRPDAAAGILAGLSPETAYGFSLLLASRNSAVAAD